MFPESFYIPAFLLVGAFSLFVSLGIIMRIIPEAAKHHKKSHSTILWLFAVGLGSIGVATICLNLGLSYDIGFFLLADAAIVAGAFGIWLGWEIKRFNKKR